MDSYRMDAESLLAHMKHKDSELERKRDWLMGYYGSSSFIKSDDASRDRSALLQPESIIREDDLFYDVAKRHVYSHFRARVNDAEVSSSHSPQEVFGHSVNSRTISTSLHNLTNNGLYLLAKFIMGSDVSLETTQVEMKKLIKNYLSKPQDNNGCGVGKNEVDIFHHLCQIMNDPQNLRQNRTKFVKPTWQSHRDAIVQILDGLKDMRSRTVSAMHRKLTSSCAYVPQFKTSRARKKKLAMTVKVACLKMLAELGPSDVLQEPLTKAMAIADLSLRLKTGCLGTSQFRFRDFSPEIDALHNEILKAVWKLENIKVPELHKLKALLDPDAELPNKGLKAALRNVLVDFLFECSDMDAIPVSLSDALALISRSKRCLRRKNFSRDIIEGDIETLLCVSADMKHIMLDCFPDCEFDEEFANAYMEELEDSDDGYLYDDCQEMHTIERRKIKMDSDGDEEEVLSNEVPESGHWSPSAATCRENVSLQQLTPTTNLRNYSAVKLEPEDPSSTELVNNSCPSSSRRTIDTMPDKQTASRNKYLAMQEVCDDASLVAYEVVGHILKGLARKGNLDLCADDWLYLGGKDVKEEKS